MTTQILTLHNLVDPDDPQGRTFKEVNMAKEHSYSIGTLVELEDGVRLWIVQLRRDCDGTPLYELSSEKDDTKEEKPGFRNRSWVGGFPEYSLKVIERKEVNATRRI